jgi:hypothetical protein
MFTFFVFTFGVTNRNIGGRHSSSNTGSSNKSIEELDKLLGLGSAPASGSSKVFKIKHYLRAHVFDLFRAQPADPFGGKPTKGAAADSSLPSLSSKEDSRKPAQFSDSESDGDVFADKASSTKPVRSGESSKAGGGAPKAADVTTRPSTAPAESSEAVERRKPSDSADAGGAGSNQPDKDQANLVVARKPATADSVAVSSKPFSKPNDAPSSSAHGGSSSFHAADAFQHRSRSMGSLVVDTAADASLSPDGKATSSRNRKNSPGSSSRQLQSPKYLSGGGRSSHFSDEALGAIDAEESQGAQSAASQQLPAWLGTPGGGGGAGGQPSGARLASPGEKADPFYKSMQQRLEQMQLEKEAVERQLRLEIDNLKTAIVMREVTGGRTDGAPFHRGASFSSGGGLLPSGGMDSSTHEHALNNDLLNEIARLKDELVIQSLKHQEEIKSIKERNFSDLQSSEARRKDDIRVIELRHEEAVSALKRLHAEELTAVKQRARDGVALEELSNQIRTTTGSLRLIEEHMNSKYKGLDIVKEGQFEARERLLVAQEEKARERAELAEAEGYRLKGILVHMEQMVATLRAQGGEERERLKYEHRRLEAASLSLEAERKSFHERMQEESDELKRKVLAHQEQRRAEERDLLQRKHALDEAVGKLARDEESFRNQVATTVASTEAGINRLKDEEARVVRAKEELRREALKLKEERNSV